MDKNQKTSKVTQGSGCISLEEPMAWERKRLVSRDGEQKQYTYRVLI